MKVEASKENLIVRVPHNTGEQDLLRVRDAKRYELTESLPGLDRNRKKGEKP